MAGKREPAASHAARVAAACLAAAIIGAAGAAAQTKQEVANRTVWVPPPFTTKAGGLRGYIPIGYIGTSYTRNGAYYLPKGWQNTALPVLVLLHGSNGTGNEVISPYIPLADKYKFILVGPDSHNKEYWFSPPTYNDSFTTDFYHVTACYRYVKAMPGVKFNYNRIAVGGDSRGGYSAASIASRTIFATHSIILHSRFIWQQMGTHIIPIWVSTGSEDTQFSPTAMRTHLAFFHSKRPEFKYTFRVFSGGHSMNNKLELESSIQWWYSTKGAISSRR